MLCKDWKPYRKNTLRGFFTMEIAGAIEIKDCTFHESHGKSWFGFPGIPYTDKEGKTQYKNAIIIPDSAMLDKVQAKVRAQLARYLDDVASQP
jgi:hypothetical protein